MAAPVHRSKDARLKHLSLVAELYLAGKYQHEIATQTGVSRQSIGYDLQVMRKLWRSSAVRDFDNAKAQELAKIDHLERTYWDAWERSCEDYREKTVRARGATPNEEGKRRPEMAEQTVRTQERDGDPRYLQGVERCIEMRAKILGLNAPVKNEVTGKDGAPLVQSFGLAEAQAILAQIDAAATEPATTRQSDAADAGTDTDPRGD